MTQGQNRRIKGDGAGQKEGLQGMLVPGPYDMEDGGSSEEKFGWRA